MKDSVQAQCASFELQRLSTKGHTGLLVEGAIAICGEVLRAFDDIDSAYCYMESLEARSGLKSAFVHAASVPHPDYGDFAFRISTSHQCFEAGHDFSSLFGAVGYENLQIPKLWLDSFKPFCAPNYYMRLFPAAFREQVREIVLHNMDNLAPFLAENVVPGKGDSDGGMHIFSELLCGAHAVRSVIADTLFALQVPKDFYAWPEILPYVYPDHFCRIIEAVVHDYQGASHVERTRAYFDSFMSERARFPNTDRDGYGAAFSNAVRDHLTGESYARAPSPWPCNDEGLATRKVFASWAYAHEPELLEVVTSALNLFEKKHQGKEVSELLKLINEEAMTEDRSNQDLWLEAVLSQIPIALIISGQKTTDVELTRLSKMIVS
ncbi:hypothetical protein [Pseudomonas sp. S1(2024)]|uniref:hypothetical protein n=1 Tax=Pseudomonas sp. S1(2024) TaxID=3390191 RepID=UPI00397DCCAA